ncbi:MAG: hypothetical protein ACTHQE_17100 [Thermomicrobiales bacterium]
MTLLSPDGAGPVVDRRRLLCGAAVMLAGALAGSSAGARVHAQGATPTPAADAPVSALKAVLSLVPEGIASQASATGLLCSYADLEAQCAALGVDRTDPAWFQQVPIVSVVGPLALASPAFQYGLGDEFVEALGFRPYDLDRALETGASPDTLSIMQGDFDRDRLTAAWKASGFAPVSLDGGRTMWSKGENGELDMSDPVTRFGAGALNNLLLLDDRTLVISRMGAVVRGVVTQAAGGAGSSMLAMPHVDAAVSALLPTTASALVVSGSLLQAGPTNAPRAGGTPSAEPGGGAAVLPPVSMASFGVEAGATTATSGEIDSGTPIPLPGETAIGAVKRAQVRLVMGSGADAATAVAVVPERWARMRSAVTGQPYRELMALIASDVVEDDPTVAAFDFDQGVAGSRWMQIVIRRDLLPFAPGPG